jgi:hypothetical protein
MYRGYIYCVGLVILFSSQMLLIQFVIGKVILKPILVAAMSKAWVCGRSLAGIAGSIPADRMDVCLL